MIDGDTLELKSAGVRIAAARLEAMKLNGKRLRLEGIDAPESDQDCETATGDRYACGQAATVTLRELVGKAENLRFESSALSNIRFSARYRVRCGWLVSEGLVAAYRQYSDVYAPLEDEARASKRGMWAGRFVMPWDYCRCLVRCQGNHKACSGQCWQSEEGGDHD